ncbi:hypothetical protein [Amycolatopsis panacis]|uniref:Uncharacterized protein n=1 Tax=Amycolatopsis panacis TaxID=2340917 RepID=A0A419HLM2_9PSEU|nr:hypothetical protein [Amycolatopsis panacis]RJQ77006.1 hypothetical protein D5S19_29870 [Amycolatopsis panacis]
MLERQRTRRELDAVRVEDVVPPELLEDVDQAGREYLEQVFREPQKYLPPRSRRTSDARAEEPAEQPESPLARRAKLAGLVGAGAMVAGAVVTAALLGGPPPAPNPAEDTAVPTGFNGSAALGGKPSPVPTPRLHRSGSTSLGHQQSSPAATATPPLPAPGTKAPRTSPVPTPSSSSAPATPGTTAAPADPVKLSAVRKFYSTIDRSPDDALALLTPKAAAGETTRLVRAWSEAEAIDVQEVRVQDDGSVFAAVLVHQVDGTLVRVTQLFDVLEQDVISQAQLLSAAYA